MDIEILARRAEALALQALLFEVTATPKPGLVDSSNNGAHHDMDLFTFIRSAAVLGPTFSACFLEGSRHAGPADRLLEKLRPVGMVGERAMLQATGGVNTHKGALFSIGLLCASAGLAAKQMSGPATAEDLCTLASEIAGGILQTDFGNLHEKPCLTAGEGQFIRYGLTGIRGEAAAGFPTVRALGMPFIRANWKQSDPHLLMADLLLLLMTRTEDSNIIHRHDPDMLRVVQGKAREVLTLGGAATAAGMKALLALDAWCIHNWVSPGGSADLLAVTLFLYLMEQAAPGADVKFR